MPGTPQKDEALHVSSKEFDSKGLAVDAAVAVTQAKMSTESSNAAEALPGAQAMGISDEPVTSSASCLVKGNTPTPNYSEALAASASNWADCIESRIHKLKSNHTQHCRLTR